MNQVLAGISFLVSIGCLTYLGWRFLRIRAYKKSLFTVVVIALILRVIGASDPYLHSWDERYHALVAKNLIEHPLTPTLHENQILEHDNENWVGSNIWLAKPSFPLWIMSGSIAVFGTNLLAVRLPSILLGLLAVWLTFLIGRKLFDERTALLAAFFHAINGLVIELIGGRVSSDHVEVCFLVLVELAVYLAIFKIQDKKALWFSFLAGAAMGLAFLSKWYPALIVIPVWAGYFLVLTKFDWLSFFKNGLVLLLGGALVALPWVFYMLNTYPKEMNGILFNALTAYSVAVESHDKPFYYYWHKVMVLFGELIYIPLVFYAYKGVITKEKQVYILLLTWILIPLIVFSMADTKRFTYLLISAPAFFIVSSWFWYYCRLAFLNAKLKWLNAFLMVALIALPVRYMIERTKFFGTNWEASEFYRLSDADRALLDEKTIVFGTDDYVEMMFHTDVHAAYRKIPHSSKIEELKKNGFQVYIMK